MSYPIANTTLVFDILKDTEWKLNESEIVGLKVPAAFFYADNKPTFTWLTTWIYCSTRSNFKKAHGFIIDRVLQNELHLVDPFDMISGNYEHKYETKKSELHSSVKRQRLF
jgi:hypothetical protein